MMRAPVTTEDAYAWFGTFLGLFPPFAIFVRIFGDGKTFEKLSDDKAIPWLILLLAMNAICFYIGRRSGRVLGRVFGDPRAHGCFWHVVVSLLLGAAWAAVTGALGGALFFVIGAVFGVFCALPVALATFPVFAVLHRIQSHGGMIEARDLWPIALGIPLATAALIMSLGK